MQYIRAFAETFPDREVVQQLVAPLPWGHNIRLIEAIKDPDERLWYARQAIEHGWRRTVSAETEEAANAARNLVACSSGPMTDFFPSQPADVAHAMAATEERQVAAIGRHGPWMPSIDPMRTVVAPRNELICTYSEDPCHASLQASA